MIRPRLPAILAAMALAWTSAAQAASPKPSLSFTIIKTGSTQAPEALIYSGGRWTQTVNSNFSAILVRHGERQVLVDTGLGAQIDAQYERDMPRWQRLFFKYERPIVPARAQLDRAGLGPVRQIILSHAHWDHASALTEFPNAEVWVAPGEMDFIGKPRREVGAAWTSQVASPAIKWREIPFRPGAYHGFDASFDLFGDGSAVLVPLYGHTPGSVGLFLTTGTGRRFFLCGDVVWSAAAVKNVRPKFWLAQSLADSDSAATRRETGRIAALARREPNLIILPAHDSRAQDRLGYFPKWID